MNDPSQHELLSAYLDGELPAEERARVERWLDEDATARRRLDELRAVTVSMKNLPAHRLDEDLSARVLRAAEHRILAEPASTADDAPRPAATDGTRSTRQILRRFLTPRAIAWSGVAIAVAILLTVVPLEQPRELARHSEKSAVTKAAPAMAAESSDAESLDGAVRSPQWDLGQPSNFVDQPAEAKPDAVGQTFDRPIAGSDADSPAAEPFAGKERSRGRPSLPEAELATKGGAPGKAAAPPMSEFTDGRAGEQLLLRKGGPLALGIGAESAVQRAAQNRAGLLVVNCGLTPEAIQNRTFTQTLGSNYIDVVEVPAEEAALAERLVRANSANVLPESAGQNVRVRGDRGRAETKTDKKTTPSATDEETSLETDFARAPTRRRSTTTDRQWQDDDRSLSTEGAEVHVVLVEGTPAQIGATIEALANRKDVRVSIASQQAGDDQYFQRQLAELNLNAANLKSSRKDAPGTNGPGDAPDRLGEEAATKQPAPAATNEPIQKQTDSEPQLADRFKIVEPRGTAQRLGTIAMDGATSAGRPAPAPAQQFESAPPPSGGPSSGSEGVAQHGEVQPGRQPPAILGGAQRVDQTRCQVLFVLQRIADSPPAAAASPAKAAAETKSETRQPADKSD